MEIRIGFADTSRELVFRAAGTQEEVASRLAAVLNGHGDEANQAVVELEDEKGAKFLIRTDKVVYVEVGKPKPHAVGFGVN